MCRVKDLATKILACFLASRISRGHFFPREFLVRLARQTERQRDYSGQRPCNINLSMYFCLQDLARPFFPLEFLARLARQTERQRIPRSPCIIIYDQPKFPLTQLEPFTIIAVTDRQTNSSADVP